jgi:hypothetical protein
MPDDPFGQGQEQIRARPALGCASDREPSQHPTGRHRSRPATPPGASKLGRDPPGLVLRVRQLSRFERGATRERIFSCAPSRTYPFFAASVVL